MCSQRIELWSHLHSRWIKITNIWVLQRLSKPTTLNTKPWNISSVWQKSVWYLKKVNWQLYFETSKFGKNSRTFPGFLEFENISRTSSEIHGLFKNLWTLGSTRCQHPPQVGISRGTGQYGGRKCLKVQRVFLCAPETTVGKVLSTSISTSESSDIFSTIWGIILDAERRKKSFI